MVGMTLFLCIMKGGGGIQMFGQSEKQEKLVLYIFWLKKFWHEKNLATVVDVYVLCDFLFLKASQFLFYLH